MNTINFIHIRKWTIPRGFLRLVRNARGEVTYPTLNNFGGCTIAYTVHRQADSLIAQYAVAECRDTDRFSKAIGRILSVARHDREEYCGIVEIPVNVEDALQEMLVEDWLSVKEEAIKESVNGKWVESIVLRDYYQPVNPGYEWIFEGDHE